jgi:hypothetical protein
MMEFLNHISTQRGTNYYDAVPPLSVWRYDLGTAS